MGVARGDTVSWHGTWGSEPAPGAAAGELRRIGPFVVLGQLGAGGMGVVLAAFDEKLERKVALKLVATRANEAAQQRLMREAQSLARLSHPNVVTIYEVDTLPEGDLFIAMELVKGQTLREWQSETKRAWADIVATYVAAGQGLAAAHRAGVVHRDFKPDNVILGEDGRVRVVDFGLAFAASAAPEPVAPVRAELGDRTSAITAEGAVIGTPGYMAPEQFTGGTVDARSDQFAFCAALYEALHGERPFADFAFAGLDSLSDAPPPRRETPDTSYPRWLWDLVLRGLSIAPTGRFASMDALLDELTRDRQRRRRRMLAALGGAGALVAVAATASALALQPPTCPLATDELTGVWDDGARRSAESAVLAVHGPSTPQVWSSTAAAFDRYAQHWLGAQQAACEATHVRHVQSADLLDRRMECLAARKRSLAAAVDVLQRTPAQAMSHAGDVLASLADTDLCADTGVLLDIARGEPGAGASSIDRARATEVRSRLARGNALLAAGDIAAAEQVVREAHAAANGLSDAVRADVQFLEGRATARRGDLRGAIQQLTQAVQLAMSGHNDELLADVWLSLALHVGPRDQRPAEIAGWLAQGEGWIRRLGHPHDPRQIDVEHAHARLQLTSGELRPALSNLSRAIEHGEALWGKGDPRLLGLLRDRALVHGQLNESAPAIADAERALAIGATAWGPSHVDVAVTRRGLGQLYIEQLGDPKRGEHELELAMAIFRDQFGPGATEVASCEQELSTAGQYRGDYISALVHAERAEQIYAAALGVDHPLHGEALVAVGVLKFMRKDFVGSLAAYEAAYPIQRTALGEGHATVGLLLSNTGETLLALGRAEAARADFEKALEIFEKTLGANHADLALPLKGLGLAELARDRPATAIPSLERALTLRTESAAANDPQELAEIRWALARALRAVRRDPTRAHDLAQAALIGYRGLGQESADRVETIAAWLRGTLGP